MKRRQRGKNNENDGAISVEDSTEYAVQDSIPKTIDGSILHESRFAKRRKLRKMARLASVAKIEDAIRISASHTIGLTSEQVKNRREEGFVNITKKKSSKSIGAIFLQNFVTPINIIAAVVAIALLVFNAPTPQFFFVFIMLLNTAIGVFQEIRAKLTVEKLSLITQNTATVIRNGERKVIPVSEVVLDDVIYIESGKQICADSIVLFGDAEANEAMLSGESVPVKKQAGTELFSGSYLSSGACYARVNKVGAANYVETLSSHARKYKKPKSELFRSIWLLIKILIPIAVVLSLATILTYYFRITVPNMEEAALRGESFDLWLSWQLNIRQAAGVMIGMLPVGMFLLTSTALFVSVVRLGKKKTLVKDFNSIEMLARVDVLCLDKTGTITDGTMTVNEIIDIKGAPTFDYSHDDIIGSMLTATEDNNQTARALAGKFGFSSLLTATEILSFSSQRKFAAVTFGSNGTFVYGAPEFIIRDLGVRLEKLINDNAAKGFRVMMLAHSNGTISGEKLPSGFRPVCLLVLEDTIRADAKDTVAWFRQNEVKVKVISGDNPITVSEVAKRVGIEDAELYISLEGLSSREVVEAATKYTVFGRVSPEQKKVLVKTLKQKGHTVAMTGDGVNDILAMRESDCAIAIASGSEAARNIANLVLQDSNFSSMPQIVMEGRRVVNNIQQTSALYIMKTIMTIILGFAFLFLSVEYPIQTNYLLLMEVIVIAAASFALALQKNPNLIKGKFLSNVIGRSAPGGITLALSLVAVYLYNLILYPTRLDALLNATPNPAYVTMIVLCVTFVGFIVLTKICEPLNTFRIVLLVITGTFLMVFAFILPIIPGFGEIYGIYQESLYVQDMFFLILVVLGSYFFMSILIRIMRALKILNY